MNKNPSVSKYGLPVERFDRLEKIISDEQAGRPTKTVLKLAGDYERDFGVSGGYANLGADIELILKNGYPPHATAGHVLENLRKRGGNIKKSIPSRPVPGLTDQQSADKSALHDNEHRRALPKGPSLCTDEHEYFRGIASNIKERIFRCGLNGFLNADQPDPRIINDQTHRPYSLREIATAVSLLIEDSGGNHPDLKGDAWFNAFERTKAAYDFQTIFPLELPKLTHIFTGIPLDCPDDERGQEISRIVSYWRKQRAVAWGKHKEKSGEDFSYTTRDTRGAKIEKLRGLAKRIAEARPSVKKKYGDQDHTSPNERIAIRALKEAVESVCGQSISDHKAEQIFTRTVEASRVNRSEHDRDKQLTDRAEHKASLRGDEEYDPTNPD